MSEIESRLLHLHTLDSLIADLVSGRAIKTGRGELFALADERERSALEWYRKKGNATWAANVSAANCEELVSSILQPPPILPALPARAANANSRRLRLKKLHAHRFAGLHKFGTPTSAPADYVHEFVSPITIFEGRNGSGKTSLVNAIIWALTGQILRPQREPETADDFQCWVASATDTEQRSEHKLSPLTPMPNVAQYRPDQAWIPADTWVELTFVDENGVELPVIRRSQSRSLQGKLKETSPDLSVLNVDPIAIRIGTVMPGLLPLIKVGSESELGRAVSELTGLAALVDLAGHVKRAKNKIDKEFIKAKEDERDRASRDYETANSDLEKILVNDPAIRPVIGVPKPTEEGASKALDEIAKHFETIKINSYESARSILGENFDPTNLPLLSDLEKNATRALERISKPQTLTSAARLGALRQLDSAQLAIAKDKINSILAEANALDALAKDPSTAARIRLYARIATWISDHPDPQRDDDLCVVCGGDVSSVLDPVTGKLIKEHIHDAATGGALLSQTLNQWAESVQGRLMRELPEVLRSEVNIDLPTHPCDLLRKAFIDELFSFEPFLGVLSALKVQTAVIFDEIVTDCEPLSKQIEIKLPSGCESLRKILERLDKAIRFAEWRHSNDELVMNIATKVLGRVPKEGDSYEKTTLIGKVLELQAIVKAAQPISDALVQCERLKKHLMAWRNAEKRLGEYTVASAALASLEGLGQFSDEQVNELRVTLRKEAADWRSRIYLGAFPSTAHELVDTGMGRKGELDLVVATDGVSAPAQHVTNASALRASLVAFFLAFWEYVLRDRGGLTTLILDDPQELLDDENRERLAESFIPLVDSGAQIITTSYDPRFCAVVAKLNVKGGVEHLAVHPATRLQPVLRTTPSLSDIAKRRARFDADHDDEEAARDFADGCRSYLETSLGDMFDEPAHSVLLSEPNPTLATFVQRLRPLVKTPHGMFGANVFRTFVDHKALVDKSPVIVLMNKSHHGSRPEIRAADVWVCVNDLDQLLELMKLMNDECYRWRRRDALPTQPATELPAPLNPMPKLELNILVCPDLAAFTQHAPSGESQEAVEILDMRSLDNVVAYYLRRPNFGFAAPAGSIAIVEAVPTPVPDRSLVIARSSGDIYARRLVRDADSNFVGLTAEIPDPRTRSPKTLFFPSAEIALHRVIGVIFDHPITIPPGKEEAVEIDLRDTLKRIEVAFRIRDESAVPLALDKQIVLGGERIELVALGKHKDMLVALTLDDGSSVFKRVGDALPGELSNLRQFESIGGLGSSQVLSLGKAQSGFRSIAGARAILGVLYENYGHGD